MVIILRRFSTSTRLLNEIKDQVRVRFAPSPTGSIHFGGLRTALYNYIFARQNKGSFLLRIEDTDQTRIVPGSKEEIEKTLEWAQLSPDESPSKGGHFGPYEQSSRLEIYKKHVDKLIQSGHAYRCFCSPMRLELLRKFQAKNREKPCYDGLCKQLTDSEIQQKLDNNEPYTVRFALKPGITRVNDMIFGKVESDLVGSKESDPILIKSDKWPTYHFANVVDDHEMRITHVFRGSEWLASTAKHVQLYDAFGWPCPTYAHLPLITMKDGSKMSKRNDNCHISAYIKGGFHPLALLNLLTNMGGGMPKDKQDSLEAWTLDEIISSFNFEEVVCHPGSIDLNKLEKLNASVMMRRWKTEPDTLVNQLKCDLDARGISHSYNHEHLTRMLEIFVIDRIISIDHLLSDDFRYLWYLPTTDWDLESSTSKDWNIEMIIHKLIDLIENLQVDDKETLLTGLKALAEDTGVKYSELMKFVRLLLTNKTSGQPIYDLYTCLGKTNVLRYLNHAKNNIK